VNHKVGPYWAIPFVCFLLSVSSPTHAAVIHFDGPFDPINWSLSEIVDDGTGPVVNAPPSFGDGSASFTGGTPATTLDLTGSDTLSGNNVITLLQIAIPSAYYLSFDWAYSTLDSGGASWDLAGFILNGVYTQLSDDLGGVSQSGSVSGLLVNPGDIFGFYIDSLDDDFGAATITIDSFAAQDVPEPSTFSILFAGLALVGLGQFRRKR
jgi:hypothetical protein